MQNGEFNKVLKEQIKRVTDTLVKKASEYATEDRLHNFKKAAALKGETPIEALSGMMAKHTVSLYDMMHTGKSYPEEVWDEKITDHINYLILLKALTVDEQTH